MKEVLRRDDTVIQNLKNNFARASFLKSAVFASIIAILCWSGNVFALCGDLNFDGSVDDFDVLISGQASIGMVRLSESQKERADISVSGAPGTPDGRILSNDFVILKEASLGNLAPFCNETGPALAGTVAAPEASGIGIAAGAARLGLSPRSGARISVYLLNSVGARTGAIIQRATTNGIGAFSMTLGGAVIPSASLIATASNSDETARSFVTSENIKISPASEWVVGEVLASKLPLGNFSPAEINAALALAESISDSADFTGASSISAAVSILASNASALEQIRAAIAEAGKCDGVCPVIPEPGQRGLPIDAISFDGRDAVKIVRGQILVSLGAGQSPSSLQASAGALNATITESNQQLGIYLIQLPAGADIAASTNAIINTGASAIPNMLFSMTDIVPNDPPYQPGADQRDRWAFEKISAPAAWGAASAANQPVIAIIDTGVDASSPDLAGRVLPGVNFATADNDHADYSGHGTHVAGIIAAAGNNNDGIAGVCWNCKILPVKVCDSEGNCPVFSLLNGISYATDNGADVINISLSANASPYSALWSLVESAVNYAATKGALVVAAAGNDGVDGAKTLPAALSNVLSVSATNADDSLASFSNFGSTVDIAAPGAGILSLAPGGTAVKDGTSAAAAFVAGAAGLLLSHNNNLSTAQLRDAIVSNADPISVTAFSGGRLNLGKSVQAISGGSTGGNTTEPPVPSGPAPTISKCGFSPDGITANGYTPTRLWCNVTTPDSSAATVTADATAINASSGSVRLFDDGAHNDGASGDGEFSSGEIYPAAGLAADSRTVKVTATSSGGAAVYSAVFTVASSFRTTSNGTACTTSWPKFHCNNHNTGNATGSTLSTPLTKRWSYTTGGAITGSPVVGNGMVIVGSADGNLYSFVESTGVLNWTATTGGAITSAAAISNGVVYVGSGDGKLYAIDQNNGAQLWTFTTGDSINNSSPAVANGNVYIGSDDHYLYAISETTHAQVWRFDAGAIIRTSPAVADGLVFIGSLDKRLYAITEATGIESWRYTTNDLIYSSPLVDNGMVFIGSNDKNVYALNQVGGTLAWVSPFTTGGSVQSSPAAFNGRIYVGSNDSKLYAITQSTGASAWTVTLGTSASPVVSSPAVTTPATNPTTASRVLVGSEDSKIYTRAETTGANQAIYTSGGLIDSSPAIANNRMFIGASDKKIYCLERDIAPTVTTVTFSPSTGIPSDGVTAGTVTAVVADTNLLTDIKSVTVDLTQIGGSSTTALYDDGTHNDGIPGDGIYGATNVIAAIGTTLQTYTITVRATDNGTTNLSGTGTGSLIVLEANPPPSVSSCVFAPSSIPADNSTTTSLSCSVTDPNNNISTVTADLSQIGGSATTALSNSGGGTWQVASGIKAGPSVVPGTYTITITATDTEGRTGTGTRNITISDPLPVITSCSFSPASVPDDGATTTTLTCNVTDANNNVSTVTANLTNIGGSAAAALTSSGGGVWTRSGITVPGSIAPGSKTVSATATDASGGTGTGSATLTVTDAPPVVSSCSFSPSSIPNDNATTTTLSCSISDPNNNLSSASVNLSSIGGSATAALSNSGGVWSRINITVPTNATTGVKTFTVTATDSASGTGTGTGSLTVTDAPPVISSCSFSPATINNDNTTTTVLTCTVIDPNGNLSTVVVDLTNIGGSSSVSMSPAGGNLYRKTAITIPNAVTAGAKTVTITGTDTSGSAGTGTASITITDPAPVVGTCSFSPASVPNNGTTTTTLSCSVTDGNNNISTVVVNLANLGGAVSSPMTFLSGTTWQKTGIVVPSSVTTGAKTVTVTAADGAGGTGSGTGSLTVTDAPPVVGTCSFSPASVPNDGATTTTLSCSITDPTGNLSSAAVNLTNIGGAASAPLTFVSGTTWNRTGITIPGSTTTGAKTVTITATDLTGGTGSGTASVTVSDAPPVVSACSFSPSTINNDATATTTLSCTVVDPNNNLQTVNANLSNIGGLSSVAMSAIGGNVWRKTGITVPSTVTIGSKTVTIAASDPVGTGTSSASITIVDPTPSITACSFTPASVQNNGTTTTTLSCTVTDGNSNVSTVVANLTNIGGAASVPLTSAGGGVWNKTNITVPTTASTGAKTVSVTATDASGGTGTGTGSLTITDTPPVVSTCTFTPTPVANDGATTTVLSCAITDPNNNLVSASVDLTNIGGAASVALNNTSGSTWQRTGITIPGSVATGAKTVTITGTDGSGVTGTGTANITVSDAPPVVGTCLFSPVTINNDGSASATLSCAVTDPNNNLSTVVANLTNIGGAASAGLTLNAGSWTKSGITVPSTITAGSKSVSITATDSAGGTGSGTASLTVTDPAPSITSCSFAPASVPNDAATTTVLSCSITDASNNITTVTANLSTLGLGSAVSLTSIGGGMWQKSAFAISSSVTPGAKSVTVTATDLSGGTGANSPSITITDAPPLITSCSFSPATIPNDATTTTTLTCSVTDPSNNVSSVTVNLALIGGSTTAALTNSGGGTWTRTSITAPVSASANAKTFTVTATDSASGTGSGTATLSITDALPVVSSCAFSPASVPNDGATTTTLSCTVTDPNGNLSAVKVDLTSIGGGASVTMANAGGSVFQKTGLTIASSMSTGSKSVTITGLDTSAGAGTGTASLTVTNAPPVVSSCSFSPASVDSDGTTQTTLSCSASDPNNNLSTVTANLSSIGGGAAVVMSLSGGVYQKTGITVPTGTAIGAKTITVTATDSTGGTGTDTATLTVLNSAPVVSSCSFSPVSVPNNNSTSTVLSCAVTDINNNISTVTVDLSQIGGSAAASMTLTSGVYKSSSIKVPVSISSGPYTFTITATDAATATGSSTASLTVTEIAPVVSSCSFSPNSIINDGTSPTTLQCTATDSNGNLASVTANLTSIGGSAAATLTNTTGNTYQLTGITTPGTTTTGSKSITITGTDSKGATGTSTAVLTIAGSPPVISACSFTPSSAPADGTTTTTLQCAVTDPNDNISTVTVNLSAIGGGTTLSLTDQGGGIYERSGITIPGTVSLGSKSVTVKATDLTAAFGTRSVTITVTDPSPTVTSCSFTPSTLPNDGTTTATLNCTVADANNNLISSSPVTANLSPIGGSTAVALSLVSASSYRKTGVTVSTSTSPGVFSITISAKDQSGNTGTGAASLTVSDAKPVVSSCSFSPSSVPADGSTTTTLQCSASDASGNLSTLTVDLSAIGGSAAEGLSLSGGTWQRSGITVPTSTAVGSKSFTVTATDLSGGTGSGTASITVTDPLPVVSGCAFSPASVPVDGTTSTTLSCTVTDANGNLSSVTANLSSIGGSTAVTMTAGAGGVYSKTGITVPISVTPGSATVTVTAKDSASPQGSGTGTASLTLTDPAPTITSCSFTPSSLANDGATTTILSCVATDTNNNISTVIADLSSIGGSAATALTLSAGKYQKTGITIPGSVSTGAKSISVTATDGSGGTGSGTASVTVSDAAPVVSACSFTPNSVPNDGATTTTLQCTVIDSNNNISSVTANLTGIGGAAAATLTNTSGNLYSNSAITVQGSTTTGAKTITVTATDSSGGTGSSSAPLTVTDAKPVVSACSFSPASIPNDNTTQTTLSCTVTDPSGNLNTVVANLTAIGGAASVTMTNAGGGTYQITGRTVAGTIMAGSKSVTVTATDSAAGTGTGSATLTVTDPLPVISSCSFSPSTIANDGVTTTILSCSVSDASNNLSTVKADLTNIGGGSAVTMTNAGGGVWQKTGLVIATTASPGSKTVTATATDNSGGTGTGSASLSVTGSNPVVSGCAFAPATVDNNGTTTMTLSCTVTDANNDVANVKADLTSIGGGAAVVMTLSSGKYQKTGITVPGTVVAGSKSVTVTATDNTGGTGSSTASATITDAKPVISSCSFSPATIQNDSLATTTLQCSVTDASNNVSTVTANLTNIGGATSVSLTLSSGVWQKTGITVPPTVMTGSKSVSVTATDLAGGSGTGSASLSITDAAPVVSACSFTPASVPDDNTTQTTLQCTVTDANNNLQTVTANLTGIGGSASVAMTTSGGGIYQKTGIVVPGTIAPASISVTVSGKDLSNGTGTGTATLTVTNAPPVVSACSFTPSSVAADGTTTTTLQCSATDSNNAVSSVTADLTAIGGAASTALTNTSGTTWKKTGITVPGSVTIGSKTITITGTDALGGTGTSTAAVTVTDAPPVISSCSFSPASVPNDSSTTTTLSCSVSDPNNNISSVVASLTSIGGAASVSLTLSGGVWSKSGIIVSNATSVGSKTVAVTATDTSGGTASFNTTLSVTDPTPVVASCSFSPASIPNDATTTTTLTCTVTDSSNNVSSVSVNLSAIGGSASTALTNAGGGSWTKTLITVATTTTTTAKTLAVTATDSAGGTGSGTAALNVTDAPPTISSCSFTPASVPNDGATTTTLNCAATDPNGNLSNLKVDLTPIGGGAAVLLTNTSGTTWQKTGITVPGTIAIAASKTITITATDAVGGTGSKTANIAIIDAPPVVSSCAFTPATVPVDASTQTTLQCTVTDPSNNLSTVAVNLSGIGGGSAVSMTLVGGVWEKTGITVPTSVSAGTKTVTVTAKDSANGSGTGTASIVLTDPPPVVSSCSFTPASVASDGVATTVVQCTVTDPNNNLSSVTVDLSGVGGSSTTAMTFAGGTAWKKSAITIPGTISAGAKTITITGKDISGGSGTNTATLTVTDAPPTITSCSFTPTSIINDGAAASILKCVATDPNNNISTVTADLSGIGGSATASLTNSSGNTWQASVTAPGTVSIGAKTITTTATDAGGGAATKTATLTIKDAPPVVSACSFTPANMDADGTTQTTLSCAVTDPNNNLSTVTVSLATIGGSTSVAMTSAGGNTWQKSGITVPSTVTAGAKTVTVTAKDTAAGTGSGTATLSLTDPKPVVSACSFTPASVPADATTKSTLLCTVTDANNNVSKVTVDLTGVGGASAVALSKTTGNSWQKTGITVAGATSLGAKTLTITATDASSGAGTSTASLTATDAPPVVASCSFSPTSAANDGVKTTTLQCSVTDPNSNLSTVKADLSSIGGGASVDLTNSSGATWTKSGITVPGTITPGAKTITVTAKDGSGGTATKTAALTVSDAPPAVSACSFAPSTIPSDGATTTTLQCTVTDPNNNLSTVTVNLTILGGAASVALTNTGGSTWQKTGITVPGTVGTGTKTVTVTGKDSLGGTGTGTASITLTNPPPAVSSCGFSPPSIPADGTTSTTLRCSVIDPSGATDIVKVIANLTQISGSATKTMTASTNNSYVVTPLTISVGVAPGSYTVSVTATDSAGGTGASSATLTVVPPPTMMVYQQSCATPPAGSWLPRYTPGMLNAPTDATVDASDNIYVADTDNNRISVFNTTCGFVRTFSSLGAGAGFLQGPKGVSFNAADGNIYVIDTYSRVQAFTTGGSFVRSWALTSAPSSIDTDSDGNVYVASSTGNSVTKYSPTGTKIAQWTVTRPASIAVDSAGNFYVADQSNNRIAYFDSVSKTSTTIVSTGTAAGSVKTPWGVAIEKTSGAINVADYGNNRIQRFTVGGSLVQKFDTYGTGNGMVNYPKGVAVANSGNLIVVDTLNHRIQVFIPQ